MHSTIELGVTDVELGRPHDGHRTALTVSSRNHEVEVLLDCRVLRARPESPSMDELLDRLFAEVRDHVARQLAAAGIR